MKIPRLSSTLKTTLLLSSIILMGFFFRIYKITDKGFFFYDEAYFMLETSSFTEGIKELKAGFKTGIDIGGIKDRLIEKGCVFPPGSARPSYILLLTITTLLLGLKDYCAFLPSIFFSTLSIYLCFLLARKYWDTRTAITAAFLISISGFNIIYSRTGYAQTTGGFFLLLGLFFYLNTLKKEAGPREAVLAGLTLGFAVTCHYGVLFSLTVLLGTEILLLLLRSHTRTVKDCFLLLLSFAAPILFYELLYRAVKFGLGARLSGMHYMTYFEQFVYVSANAPRDLSLSSFLTNDYLFYPRELVSYDGYLLAGLALAAGLYSLVRIAKKRSPVELVLFSQSYAILAFWILNPGAVKGGRILMLFHPLLMMFTAKMLADGFSALKAAGKTRDIFLSAFLVLLAAVNAGTILAVVHTRTHFRDMARLLKDKGINDVAVFNLWPMWQFHMRHKIWANLDRIKTEKDLLEYCRKKKIDYLVLDFHGPIADRPERGENYGFLYRIAAEKTPEFFMNTDDLRENLRIYGNIFTPKGLLAPGKETFFDRIKCYRIDKLGSKPGHSPPSRPRTAFPTVQGL